MSLLTVSLTEDKLSQGKLTLYGLGTRESINYKKFLETPLKTLYMLKVAGCNQRQHYTDLTNYNNFTNLTNVNKVTNISNITNLTINEY